MCGITGIWRDERASAADLMALAGRMAKALAHRGPDDEGTWADAEVGLALGHRRLAIVDLSADGHQPMCSPSGKRVLVYNGEVYNHEELRGSLRAAGATFRGRSDTEVLLAGFERWGVEATLARAVGMFAFALWDGERRSLTLGRDRMGEKPLYYGRVGGAMVFASELKALRVVPGWESSVDRDALWLYLRHGYVPGAACIHRGLRKLPPGCLVTLRHPSEGLDAPPRAYWSLADVVRRGAAEPLRASDEEVADELERRLRASVRGQQMADVPLGAFLSGGIDSSAVVALMQAESGAKVRTFTVGFDDPRFDEAAHARAIAEHLGTLHTEMTVTAEDARGLVPSLPTLYDEPMGDYSQLPTCLIARLTRQHVTVSLSADGGDELFGGYHTYRWSQRFGSALAWVPKRLRARARPDAPAARRLARTAERLGLAGQAHRALRLADLVDADGPEALFRRMALHWADDENPVLGARGAPEWRVEAPREVSDTLTRLSFIDGMSYLPDDVLVKVDRASMAASLESRAPLLDHRIVELAFRIPARQKMHRGVGKLPLRRVLYRYVPRELVDRPKMGFSVPMAAWLRGPLREWAGDLLSADRLRRQGLLDAGAVQARWQEHLAGARDWKYALWDVVVLQAWLEALA